MSRYDYECKECGDVHEEVHSMRESPDIACPKCGGSCQRIITCVNIRPPVDMFWEGENGGRGRYIGGLGTRSDSSAYCRSLSEAKEKAKAKNLTYELG